MCDNLHCILHAKRTLEEVSVMLCCRRSTSSALSCYGTTSIRVFVQRHSLAAPSATSVKPRRFSV